MEWILFSEENFKKGILPQEKKFVLIQCRQIQEVKSQCDPIVIGYLKYAAGDKECPYFIRPGCFGIGEPYRWCDCLPDDFNLWPKGSYEEIFNNI